MKSGSLGTSLEPRCWRSPRAGDTGGDGVALPFCGRRQSVAWSPSTSSFYYICVRGTGIARGNLDFTTGIRLIQRSAPSATVPLCLCRAAGGCSQPTRSPFHLSVCFCGQVSCSPRSLGTLLPLLGSLGSIWRCFVLPSTPVGGVVL